MARMKPIHEATDDIEAIAQDWMRGKIERPEFRRNILIQLRAVIGMDEEKL